MDFKKKLKTRLYTAISYIVIGIVMIIVSNILKTDNDFLNSFGLAVAACGVARVLRYLSIMESDESIRKQEIAETDERNITISNKARSTAFAVYIYAACISVIVLEFMNKSELSSIIALSVCALVFIYWISYFIMQKKY